MSCGNTISGNSSRRVHLSWVMIWTLASLEPCVEKKRKINCEKSSHVLRALETSNEHRAPAHGIFSITITNLPTHLSILERRTYNSNMHTTTEKIYTHRYC